MSWRTATPLGASLCLQVLFILPGPGFRALGPGKVKPVGQSLPPQPPTASKLGNLVAGTKPVFVGLPSCLGGCSRTTAFLARTEATQGRCSGSQNHGLATGRGHRSRAAGARN